MIAPMPLLETLIATVAPSIAKTVLKIWAADGRVAVESATSTIEILAKVIPDIRARTEAERQLATIGERAAQSLQFIFDTEGRAILTDDQESLARLLAEALDHSKISADILLGKDLDPTKLAEHLVSQAESALSSLPPERIQLFRRIVQEASESIIDIAQVLPNFSERTFAELLRRDRVLMEAADRAMESLERIRAESHQDLERESAVFETEYRRAITRNLDRMDLFGVDLSRASRSHPLSVAYISLEVGRAAQPPAQPPQRPLEEDTEEEEAVEAIESVLGSDKRILIKGVAGAGKTTLARWIAVMAASRRFEPPLQEWNDSVPFVIRLRQFSDCALPAPENFPALGAQAVADNMPRGWVHTKLKSGDAAVMVDGIDEVPASRREEVRTWLTELANAFPQARLVVTSRPHAVEKGWLEPEGFVEADLQPMDNASIETFVEHWHNAVAAEVGSEADAVALKALADKLKVTLRSNRAIRRLATNPLLCAVICALHRDTNEQLPEDRLDLYERCSLMLLDRRDPESGLSLRDYARLTYRQKRALLDDLAYWMIKNRWSEVATAGAIERFAKRLETMRIEARDGAPATAENVLRLFLERSGMIREPVPAKIDFAHRTFQEFMAASAAVEQGDFGVLLHNANDVQWREVVILAAGLARRNERADLIRSLLASGDAGAAERHRLHLLAAACLDTAVDLPPQLRADVENRIEKLVPPKTVAEAAQLADAAGEIAVPFLKRGLKRFCTAREETACVRALALIGSAEAIEAIGGYAGSSSRGVLKEIVRSAERLDPRLFLELVAPHMHVQSLPGDAVSSLIRRFGFGGVLRLERAKELKLSAAMARDLSVLRSLPDLEDVHLAGTAVRDLNALARLTRVRTLVLSQTAVTDLSPLQGLASLRHLTLWNHAVRNVSVAGLTGLESLQVWGSGADLQSIARLTGLQRLTLGPGGPIGDGGLDLSPLDGQSTLRFLTVWHFSVSNPLVLPRLPNLEGLYLYRPPVNSIADLRMFPNLTHLVLGYMEIPDTTVLADVPHLRSLSFIRCGLGKDAIGELRQKRPHLDIDWRPR